jgi:hypothetical protein
MSEQKMHQGQVVRTEHECSRTEELGLSDHLSARISQLQDIAKLAQTELHWNCFGALQFILGSNSVPQLINQMPEFGLQIDIDHALSSLRQPFVFQICGRYELPGEFNMGTDEYQGVIHAGIVFGIDPRDLSIKVFEKNGREGALQVSPWHEVMQRFPTEIEYFRFFEMDDKQFQEWCKNWDRL